MAGGNFAATLWKIPGNHFYVVGQQQGRQFDVCRKFFFSLQVRNHPWKCLGVFSWSYTSGWPTRLSQNTSYFFGCARSCTCWTIVFFPHAVRTRLPTAHGWMKTILKKWGRFWMLWTTKRHLSGFYKGGHFHCQGIWKWLWGTERNLCLKRWEKWIASFDLSAVKPNVFMLCFHTYTVQITNNMCVFCFSWLDPHLPVFVPMYIDIYISHQLHFRVLSFFDLRRLWNKQTTCH